MKRIFAALILIALSTVLWAGGRTKKSFEEVYGAITGQIPLSAIENTGQTTFPTLSIPMGGQYEGMGTAYTAVGRDASFFESNPAASSQLEFTEVSLYHNNVIADTSMESMVYTSRWGELGMAAGGKYLHVPFTAYDDFGVQELSTRFAEAIVGLNISYNFLRSFDFSGIAVGATTRFAYRSLPIPDQSFSAFMVDAGVLSRFNFLKFYPSRSRNLSVAATVRNLGPPVSYPDGQEPLPSTAAFGIAYSPLRPLLFSFDLNVPFTLDDTPAERPGFAVGTDVTVTDFFSIRGGFRWKGGNPRISLGGSLLLENVRIAMNYTLDLTTQLTAFDRISVQASFDLGDRGRGAKEERLRNYYLDALVAFAAGELEETIRLCEEALEIDPRFQPAQETLATARRMLELQQEMESIRLE